MHARTHMRKPDKVYSTEILFFEARANDRLFFLNFLFGYRRESIGHVGSLLAPEQAMPVPEQRLISKLPVPE